MYGVVLRLGEQRQSTACWADCALQLISYEIPVGLGILGIVLMSGSLRLETIITQQAQSGVWNVLVQPLGFVVFVVAFSPKPRLPFDLSSASRNWSAGITPNTRA